MKVSMQPLGQRRHNYPVLTESTRRDFSRRPGRCHSVDSTQAIYDSFRWRGAYPRLSENLTQGVVDVPIAWELLRIELENFDGGGRVSTAKDFVAHGIQFIYGEIILGRLAAEQLAIAVQGGADPLMKIDSI